jgi:DNA polymerase-3 subunit delta'
VVPTFGAIVGQQRALKILGALVARGGVPHALLFTGIDGIGKATTARALAMVLNCRSPLPVDDRRLWPDACGRCRSCRRIAASLHPDVIQLQPEGAFFKIGQIRGLLDVLALKPYEARYRVAILCDAQAMTAAAANALLKILEEPPDQTMLVLTAGGVSDLLPTIVSRCQPVRFAPLDPARIVERLTQDHGVAAEDAVVLAALAGGSLASALALARQGAVAHWRRRRDWLAQMLPELGRQGPMVALAAAEELARDGRRATESLELVKTWLRDQLVVALRPELVVHGDRREDLHRLARQDRDDGRRIGQIRRIQEAQRALEANAAVRLTLESLFFDLAQDGGTPSGSD